ncbi:hypothetical protein TraAM80_10317, partial [Trypanosoma rangeli]
MAGRVLLVCALCVLCCCSGFFCITAAAETAGGAEVLVDISCEDTDGKVSWRLHGESAWKKCAFTVTESFYRSGSINDPKDSLCVWAGTLYPNSICK